MGRREYLEFQHFRLVTLVIVSHRFVDYPVEIDGLQIIIAVTSQLRRVILQVVNTHKKWVCLKIWYTSKSMGLSNLSLQVPFFRVLTFPNIPTDPSQKITTSKSQESM